jgi:pimeloyl-ACP methyl ester carboxylesterase
MAGRSSGHDPVEGAGHWVQQESPAEVNAALIGFLDALAAEDRWSSPI